MGTLRINGEVVPATHFAFDGCHKIYLIFTAGDSESMYDNGYEGGDIYPVSELTWAWANSCFLRFISRADLDGPNIVPQGYDVEPFIEWVP